MADTPLVIHEVSNRTSRVYFADESDADRYISSFPGSVGGGMRKTRIDVVPPADTPTSAARPMQGLTHWLRCEAVRHRESVWARDPAVQDHINTLSLWASEVEAVQAQPASITESLPICAKVSLVFAQPASAPMGEPSEAATSFCLLIDELLASWRANTLPWLSREVQETENTAAKRERRIKARAALESAIASLASPHPASPAQARMPLSEEQIDAAFQTAFPGHDMHQESINFARAIEAAHGISGESSGAACKAGVEGNDHAR